MKKKVMPDVMTPESMVTKLDAFDNLVEEATQEERDVSGTILRPHVPARSFSKFFFNRLCYFLQRCVFLVCVFSCICVFV